MPARPAVLFLDLGNVVIRWHAARLCANLATLAGTSAAAIADCLRGTPHDAAYVEGRIDTATFRERFGAELGVRFAPDAFTAAWNDVFERDGAMEALVEAVAPVIPTYALSNTNALHFDWLTAHLPVWQRFRAVVASHEVGAQKPDPRIYLQACTVAGCDPGQAVFVDDLADNVAGARALGFDALQFTGVDRLRADLQARGVPVAPAHRP